MESGPSFIDRFMLGLPSKPRPKICYLGTPNGDMPDGIEKFYAAFSNENCQPSHLSFFRKPSRGSVPLSNFEEHLAEQDIIFVSGGSTKSSLGVWREWGADNALCRAYHAGVLLCGMSAGAICWFDAGWTDSIWGAGFQPLRGLGLLRGGCAVHYGDGEDQRKSLHDAIRAGTMPATIAIADHAAVLFEDETVSRVLRWGPRAAAYALSAEGESVVEVEIDIVRHECGDRR